MSDHAEEVREFMERRFSGADLIAVLDLEGIGVGSAMHLVREVEHLRGIKKGTLGQGAMLYRRCAECGAVWDRDDLPIDNTCPNGCGPTARVWVIADE